MRLSLLVFLPPPPSLPAVLPATVWTKAGVENIVISSGDTMGQRRAQPVPGVPGHGGRSVRCRGRLVQTIPG